MMYFPTLLYQRELAGEQSTVLQNCRYLRNRVDYVLGTGIVRHTGTYCMIPLRARSITQPSQHPP